MPLHLIAIALAALALMLWLVWAESGDADLTDGADDHDL